VFSGFRRNVDENFESQEVLDFLTLEDVTYRLSVKNYHSTLRNIPEERKSFSLVISLTYDEEK
jgi:hypothetical protein